MYLNVDNDKTFHYGFETAPTNSHRCIKQTGLGGEGEVGEGVCGGSFDGKCFSSHTTDYTHSSDPHERFTSCKKGRCVW